MKTNISFQIKKMDIKTKQEFVQWVKRAVSTSDDCYIELYNLLLRYINHQYE